MEIGRLLNKTYDDLLRNNIDIDKENLTEAANLLNDVFKDEIDEYMIQFIELERKYRNRKFEVENDVGYYAKCLQEVVDDIEEKMGTIVIDCKAVSKQIKKNFPQFAELWDKLLLKYRYKMTPIVDLEDMLIAEYKPKPTESD